ncbi:TPA: radical SAM protein [Vibrio parahaemolyticus]|uniref:radical SAM protein n=1 Tax=Vibrio parahaemolyticus TaxID=670 RepID=UPI0022B5B3BD|nr:radical SAM protein [Vibrio parahaemolyticus]ELB1989226.1 radical SAM protein [Vibrio parahaemolyticus]MCZ6311101.1 radical SAM protein [Vibrio parahaemolyticus]HBN6178896.1 radical SAM protein [Vibrio parahaemolyticus]HBN6318073.1 radical SAM protein [Vibrio parahaemolyticus]HCD5130800.1 radical SAM protein [Vibrio parahaemolyticus]
MLGSYKIYRRDGEMVIFDPDTLESILLDSNESILFDRFLLGEYSKEEPSQLSLIKEISDLGLPLPAQTVDPKEALNKRLTKLKVRPDTKDLRISGYRIVLTDKCNMNCKYCFVSTNTGKPDMEEQDLYESLVYLFKQNKNRREITIQWFGGEPLIKFNLIEKGVVHCEELAKKYNIKKVRYSVVTNGVKITDRMLSHFSKYKYGIGVSLDGGIDINDYSRNLISGKSAYDIIIKNLERLRNTKGVSLGVNITPTRLNHNKMLEITKYVIHKLDIKFIYVNFPIPVNGCWEVSGSELAKSFFEARYYALSQGAMFFSAIERVYQALDSRQPKVIDHVACDGGLSAALLPKKVISFCDINWENPDFLVAINDIVEISKRIQDMEKPLLKEEQCYSCTARQICGGVPLNDQYLLGSNFPDKEFCSFYTSALELCLWDGTCIQ